MKRNPVKLAGGILLGGTSGISALNIRGASESRFRSTPNGGVPLMRFIKQNENELTALVAYMKYLNERP